MPKVGTWRKYPPEFKQKAIERMASGENISAIARELGVRRKFLYKWKEQQAGNLSAPAPPVRDPRAGELAALRKRVADLERLAGQQAAELDFFAAALRNNKESRPASGADSGSGSTRRSKP